MARTPRRETRAPAGPGRGKTRSRAVSRPTQTMKQTPSKTTDDHTAVRQPIGLTMPGFMKTHGLTSRALLVLLVVSLLTVSYGRQVYLYLEQQSTLRATEKEIADSQQRIDQLNDAIDRWQDPVFVKTQARDRLGWVVPGETSYVVIDADGKPLAGSSAITRDRSLERANAMVWWQRAWDTVVAADVPLPKSPSMVPAPTPPKPTPTSKRTP